MHGREQSWWKDCGSDIVVPRESRWKWPSRLNDLPDPLRDVGRLLQCCIPCSKEFVVTVMNLCSSSIPLIKYHQKLEGRISE